MGTLEKKIFEYILAKGHRSDCDEDECDCGYEMLKDQFDLENNTRSLDRPRVSDSLHEKYRWLL